MNVPWSITVRTEGEEPELEPATRGFEDPSISEATRLDGWARSAQITDGRTAYLSQMPYVEPRLEIMSREASEDANPLSSPRNAAASTVRLHAPATILQPRMNDNRQAKEPAPHDEHSQIPRVFYCVAPSANGEQMISVTGCGISPSYIVDWDTRPRIRIRNARLVVALCPAVTISPLIILPLAVLTTFIAICSATARKPRGQIRKWVTRRDCANAFLVPT
ncbi:hypothetical protein EDB89DRAFT_1904019 [Lactarius sanguifluus]|nr:hypothetical protein EDB89DRAFT_1904019 [Lactarius sanguifluus]